MRAATSVLESFLKSQQVSTSIARESITVVGLRGPSGNLDYLLLDEAFERGTVEIEETGEEGSVPHCRVTNRGDRRLLLFEGEELRGAKQNRAVNLTLLLEPRSQTVVPVSCVEKGRWHYESRSFAKGGRVPGRINYTLKSSVTRSLRDTRAYDSNQSAVWSEVDACLSGSGVFSHTSSLSDALERKSDELEAFAGQFEGLRGCNGFAVFRGERLELLELFDRPETFDRLRDQLLHSLAFDTLFARDPQGAAGGAPDVYACLEQVAEESSSVYPSVGLGQTLRIQRDDLAASALVVDGEVLHFSLQRG